MSDPASHISIQGVHKVFESGGQEVHALRAIDLEIPRGQFVCLLGLAIDTLMSSLSSHLLKWHRGLEQG